LIVVRLLIAHARRTTPAVARTTLVAGQGGGVLRPGASHSIPLAVTVGEAPDSERGMVLCMLAAVPLRCGP
jgi:hypothetical protein